MARLVVEPKRLAKGVEVTQEEFDEALDAIADGRASQLWKCEVHGPQGVKRTVRIPGTSFDFNASDNIELRCGCWLV